MEFWGLFREYMNVSAQRGRCGSVCRLLVLLMAVGLSLLNSHAQRNKKEEIRYPDSEDQTCPKKLNPPNQQEAV